MADVELERSGAVATLRLNRPARRNATTPALWRALDDHLAAVAADAGVRAVVLTGAGGAFCAGTDVSGELASSADDARERLRLAQAVVLRLYHCPKPVIAAVQGAAVGSGLSLALCADFIVADATARFSYAFTRLGLLGDAGALWLLAQRVGLVAAKDLIYTGRFVTAPQALALGLAWRCWPQASFADEVQALAAELAAGPPLAVAASKRLLQRPWESLAQYLPVELDEAPGLAASADVAEGLAALRQRRAPVFQGR